MLQDTMSASEFCVEEILSSHFSSSLSPGNAKINLHLTFRDIRTYLLEVGLWVVSVTVVILRDLTAG